MTFTFSSGRFHSLAKSRRVVTRIERGTFYPAEAVHQDFLRRNPRHPYIVRWDQVKVDNLKRVFPKLYTAKPVRG